MSALVIRPTSLVHPHLWTPPRLHSSLFFGACIGSNWDWCHDFMISQGFDCICNKITRKPPTLFCVKVGRTLSAVPHTQVFLCGWP